MKALNQKRERLSIDVLPQERMKIKVYAALHGKTIRDYVIDIVKEQLRKEEEANQLSSMAGNIAPSLKKVWDSKQDAAYDEA